MDAKEIRKAVKEAAVFLDDGLWLSGQRAVNALLRNLDAETQEQPIAPTYTAEDAAPEHTEIEKPPFELRISTWVALNAWASAVDSRLKSLGERYLDLRVGRMHFADEVAAEVEVLKKRITTIQKDAITDRLPDRVEALEKKEHEHPDLPFGTVKLDST